MGNNRAVSWPHRRLSTGPHVRSILLLVCFSTLVGCGDDEGCDSLLGSIRTELQLTNPAIVDIQVLDAKPKHTKYWLVARGIISPADFNDSLDDELFALFVVDESFACVEATVDVFATPRWQDYELWIDSYDMEKITIRGRGATYHESAVTKSFQVPR